MDTGKIRLVLVDDHPALLYGLELVVTQSPDIVIVGKAGDGEEALRIVEETLPDVAVLDCHLPIRTGPEVAREIRARALPTRVLAFSGYSDRQCVTEMLNAGATGYLLKEEPPEVIWEAIRAVARGKTHFSPSVMKDVLAWRQQPQPGRLTEHEIAVLRLIVKELSNKEIAHQLKVAERTVEFHVSNILHKLGVSSRTGAALWARDHSI